MQMSHACKSPPGFVSLFSSSHYKPSATPPLNGQYMVFSFPSVMACIVFSSSHPGTVDSCHWPETSPKPDRQRRLCSWSAAHSQLPVWWLHQLPYPSAMYGSSIFLQALPPALVVKYILYSVDTGQCSLCLRFLPSPATGDHLNFFGLTLSQGLPSLDKW